MTIPAPLLTVVIWLALAGVAAGSLYLLIVLFREWRDGTLW